MSGPATDHANHDETLVAAYAAGDLGGPELARAEALTSACPACAELATDLVAIAAATRTLPAPARSRDFRLSADDAARLRGAAEPSGAPREPAAAVARHSGVDRRRPLPTDHADHDETLVAAYAAGDLSGPELARAQALTSACPACAELATDLVAIAAATRTLPAPARSRDFRLSADDAARLRRTSLAWRLRSLGRPALRPFALGLTTIGLAGLLIGVAAPGNTAIFGSAGGTPTNDRASSLGESQSGGAASPASPASGAGDLSGKGSAASPPVPEASPPVPAVASHASPTPAAVSSPVPAPASHASPTPAAVSSPVPAPASPTQATPAAGGPQTTPTTPAAASGGPSPLAALSSLVLALGVLLLVVPVLQGRRRRRARDDPG